jgi:hypothetical protein
MEILKEGTNVKYMGKTNDYTFKKDIHKNSIGIIKNFIKSTEKITYKVEFENGIIASIDSDDFEILS